MEKPIPPSVKRHRLRWFLIFLAAMVLGFGVGGYLSVMNGLPPAESISFFNPPIATRVFDQNDQEVGEFFVERRELTSLERVPKYLKDGLICIEDKQFYRHWGINLFALLRSLLMNMLHMRVVGGGSTITMQLARNMFLTQEQTIGRKLKEMALAIRIERAYTKDEILEKYLNQVNFGQGRYGVETAAHYYYGKEISDLDLSQCAMLIALAKSPEIYNPYKHPKRALSRRNLVLQEMFKGRYITREEYEPAVAEPLNVIEQKVEKTVGEYYLEEIRRYLELKYGGEFLYRSGANIYTNMDLNLQKTCEEKLEKHLAQLEKEYHLSHSKVKVDSLLDTLSQNDSVTTTPYLQGAIVVIDQHTGGVKAIVGGRDFGQSKFNRATQASRQTGSIFKVFVFAAAIDNGFTAADIVLDLPIVLEIPGVDSIYRPSNFDNRFMGPITLKKALALSRNLVAVRLIRTIGPDLVVKYAHNLGIMSPLLPVISLALGSCGVSLMELTHAISTIANYGEETPTIMIRKITNKDNTVIERNEPQPERRLSPQVSYVILNMMRAVVDGGTGFEVRKYYKGPAAGKTGTSNNYADNWYVGFTSKYTCGIWVGYDDNQRIFRGATGGIVAAPIWGDIMRAVDSLHAEEFPIPEGMVWCKICPQSGLLATEYCPQPKEEVFIKGSEPTDHCDIHSYSGSIEGYEQFEKIDRAATQGY
jgi:penicillin-binding protein 1A